MGPLCEIPLPLSASRATTWGSRTDPLAPPVSQGPMGISRGSTLPQRPFARCGALAVAVSTLRPSAQGQVHGSSPRNPWGSRGGPTARSFLAI